MFGSLEPFSSFQIVLISLASFGLAICVVIEQAQLLAKYWGALRKRIAGGYNSAMKIMVVNRFGAALYFLLISISVDLGMPPNVIASFFLGAIVLVMIFDLVVTASLIKTNQFTLKSLRNSDIALAPVIMAMIASLFGILGLTLPMLLSSANPELRLTMANTGFILNSVFTILVVFFVESYLAKIIDDPEQQHRMGHFVLAVFIMRFFGAILALLLMLVASYNSTALDLGWLFLRD